MARKLSDNTSGISIPENASLFGTSVFVEGADVFVGLTRGATHGNSGEAYYLTKNIDGSWTSQKMNLGGGVSSFFSQGNGRNFGAGITFGNGRLFIGAPGRLSGSSDPEGFGTFTKSGNSWTFGTQTELVNEDGFAKSLAFAEDTDELFVGHVGGGSTGSNRGAVYVYQNPYAVANEQSSLRIDDSLSSLTLTDEDQFGFSVAVSNDGNILFVGAPFDDTGGGNNTGAVYIFERIGSTWNMVQKIAYEATDLSLSDNDLFGESLALSNDGNILFIGAGGNDTGDDTEERNRGAVYVFTKEGGDWAQTDKIDNNHSLLQDDLDVNRLTKGDRFGSSIAIDDDNNLYVGAKNDITGGNRKGAVYIFTEVAE